MKKVFFIGLILISALRVCAQPSKDEYKTMIDSAISLKYAAFKAAGKNQNNKYYFENLYLINEQDQPLNYLSASNKFKFITVYDERNRKAIAKGIYAWKVLTTLNQNHLTVIILDLYITYKNHNYNFSNSGGSKTIFEYECDQNNWKLLSSENKGN